MNINLQIERLIIDGLNLAPGHGARVKATVETELSRLLTARGLPQGLQNGAVLPNVRPASIQVSAGSNPLSMGRQIARAVYGSISGGFGK
jgi:hypothetical protein